MEPIPPRWTRVQLSTILETSCPPITQEPDWIEFMIDELLSVESIETPLAVYNLLGEHLECIIKPAEVNAVVKEIFAQLSESALDSTLSVSDSIEAETGEVDSDSEDGAAVGDGDCVICHRTMPLTKHHLTPRSVHKWHKNHNGMTHEQLHTGINICRDCHDAVHKFIKLKDMGFEYNTLEKILEHPKVINWIPYISKRRPTNKSDRRTWRQRSYGLPSDDEPEAKVYLELK